VFYSGCPAQKTGQPSTKFIVFERGRTMLKAIYREIIKHEHETVKRERLVDDLINRITEPYKGQLSDRDMEILKDLLSAVALAGEEAGFEIGAKFAVRLLRELS